MLFLVAYFRGFPNPVVDPALAWWARAFCFSFSFGAFLELFGTGLEFGDEVSGFQARHEEALRYSAFRESYYAVEVSLLQLNHQVAVLLVKNLQIVHLIQLLLHLQKKICSPELPGLYFVSGTIAYGLLANSLS